MTALTTANAIWVEFSSGGTLHRLLEGDTFGLMADQRAEGKTVCGRVAMVFMPSLDSRMSTPRCQHCCRVLGIPAGPGTPVNANIAEPTLTGAGMSFAEPQAVRTDQVSFNPEDARDDVRRLKCSPEQVAAIKQAFCLWLWTARQDGYPPMMAWPSAESEVLHSGLLNRILSGQPPATARPPLRHGQPNYALVDSGESEVCCVTEEGALPGTIMLDDLAWSIVERRSAFEMVVEWPPYRCILTRRGLKSQGIHWTLKREKLEEKHSWQRASRFPDRY